MVLFEGRRTHVLCDKTYGKRRAAIREIQDARQLYGLDMIGEEAL